jgi:hypothetical protein
MLATVNSAATTVAQRSERRAWRTRAKIATAPSAATNGLYSHMNEYAFGNSWKTGPRWSSTNRPPA